MAASRLAAIVLIGVVSACTTITPVATPTSPSQSTPTTAPTTAPTDQPTANPTAEVTPTPTAPSTATPAPTVTIAPTPVPTATPQAQLGLGWSAVDFAQTGDTCCWQVTSADAGYLIFAGNADGKPMFFTSTNGSTWRSIDDIVWPGGVVLRIGAWDGSFLAAGVSATPGDPRLGVWQSPDGRTWFRIADLALPGAAHSPDQLQVPTAYGTEDKIAVVAEIWPDPCHEGCDGPLAVRRFSSVDNGGSWKSAVLDNQLENHDPPVTIAGVSVQVSQFWDDFESSTDGKSWQPITEPTGGRYWPSTVRLTPTGAVAVGYVGDREGGLVLVSTDGITWTQSVGWPDLDSVSVVNDVAGYGTTLVLTAFNSYSGAGYVLVSLPLN